MFCVRIKDSKFVIVRCDAEMKPIKYVDDILVTIGGSNRVDVLFTSDIKDAYRFEDAELALDAIKLILDRFDRDFTDNLTIGRIYGEDELLCLYD